MSNNPPPRPYVVFETRAVEDRTASETAGHYVPKDIHFACITPAGTRDRIEKVVEDWLRDLDEGAKQERIPPEWPSEYRKAYAAWKEGREIPEEGTAILNWPVATPAQVKLLLDMGIRTVEQLAEATEEAVVRIGMGGRALKSKAQAWLDSAKGQGKLASELDNLRKQVEALTRVQEENSELKLQIKALQTSADKPTEKA